MDTPFITKDFGIPDNSELYQEFFKDFEGFDIVEVKETDPDSWFTKKVFSKFSDELKQQGIYAILKDNKIVIIMTTEGFELLMDNIEADDAQFISENEALLADRVVTFLAYRDSK